MKKITTLFITCFLCFSLFAGIPDCLKDWIIPNDYDFGTSKIIPELPEKSFFLETNSNDEVTSLSVYKPEISNIEIPSWFKQKTKISWDSKFFDAFLEIKKCKKFQYYASTEAWVNKNDDSTDHLYYAKKIVLFAPKNPEYTIILYFYKENDYTLSEIYIKFIKDRKKLPINETDYFKTYYQKNWNTFSELEQTATALSSILLINQEYDSTFFDLSYQSEKTVEDAKNLLSSDWEISNKNDLYKELEGLNHSTNEMYFELLNLIENNKGLSPLEIAENEEFNALGVSRLVFVNEMKDKIGKNGLIAWDLNRKLFIIRLSIFCGYITKNEGLNLAKPIVDEILAKYTSFEDFIANHIMGTSFRGIQDGRYIRRAANALNDYQNLVYEVSTAVEFNGTQADKDHILEIDNCWYTPSEYYQTLFDVQEARNDGITDENIHIVKNAIEKYGDFSYLTNLLENIYPVRYEDNGEYVGKDFFEKYYRKTWEGMPEIEQYAVAFSSNLFSINNDYLLDFTCQKDFADEDYYSAKILKDSWDITSHDELIETIKSLQSHGHAGTFKELSNLCIVYPDKTPIEIGKIEGLSVYEIIRLEFVSTVREKLGTHGIEAWDMGREISLLRWGINAGYTTKEDALEIAEPIVKKIITDYVSWEDFMSHYICGRCFFSVTSNDYEDYYEEAYQASLNVIPYIPTDELVFTATHADKEHILQLEQADYFPTIEAKNWEKVIKLYNSDNITLEDIGKFEQEFPDMPCFIYVHAQLLDKAEDYFGVISYIEENMEKINQLNFDNSIYMNFHYLYLCSLNEIYQPKKCLQHFDTLPRELQENLYVFFEHAYANYLLANITDDMEERISYQSRAINEFNILKRSGFNIGVMLDNWIKSVNR